MPRPNTSRNKWQEALSEAPQLQDGQSIGRVVQGVGENNYEVECGDGEKRLYQLPKRLRHVALIRRDIFVFVRDDATRQGKIQGDIEVVVMEQFLKALRKEPFWPAAFTEERENEEASEEGASDDDWEVGGGNPNRRTWTEHEVSDSSEED